ncbi:RNA-directed DNA polymerase, eukaryota, reverse transcriptase zinc-binding domain protein [Tanacetum coccineum]
MKVSDFRPIACCNVVYKCISKIITNRIKSGLAKLVQNNQSAFIPKRVIQDNIMLSQEILRGYGRKNGPKRCAIKIDLQKAYDTRKIRDRTEFKYHQGCNDLQLINLCFADDLMIFCHGDAISVSIVKEAIEEFSNISGLHPNLNKSSLFFGSLNVIEKERIIEGDNTVLHDNNVLHDNTVLEDNNVIEQLMAWSGMDLKMAKTIEKERIMEVMQFKEGSLSTKYLGVPLITKQLGINECKSLIDNIKGKNGDWKYKYLSYAGRLMLIATVLEAISVYWASVFKIPKTVIKEINGILKRYLWSNSESARGKAKVAWKQVCKPKDCGGLGVKDLEKWNEALLAKHLWNIASKKDSLWVKWIHAVRLKDASIWNVQWNEKDGWNWKCLLEIRDKIAHNFQFKIGDGSNILMWYDVWHADGLLINKVTNRDLYNARIPKMIGINSMMVNGEWNWPEWNGIE